MYQNPELDGINRFGPLILFQGEGVRIRECNPNNPDAFELDLAGIITATNEYIGELSDAPADDFALWSIEDLKAMCQPHSGFLHRFLVAENLEHGIAGNIRAFLLLVPGLHDFKRPGKKRFRSVAKEFLRLDVLEIISRQSGLGKLLLKQAVALAEREGFQSIDGHVPIGNEKIRVFYEACGFTRDSAWHDYSVYTKAL